MEVVSFSKGDFFITTDPQKLDRDAVCRFLADTYWARRRPPGVITRSLENSLCFSLFHREEQIGFGRVVTDYATFAYLCDVYLLEKYRGRGLGKWLIECIVTHSDLARVNWCLLTGDAHSFYEQFGFRRLRKPQHFMEKRSKWPY